ncbi:GNAT family N-acetyltransferase [Cohnella nanjingensis]|uniref:GNAT family N-acetyltransferase n=1 Tax=Cohnella nanjingensis TaxID=1387779 RepID=A0A7X0RS61_9BACL|nr:GNAT family N-acetyltransferase [Cohnella nanjingensis]MBB6672693.1 GNAT family N-acetyltransferase [Cohnella nanjingensis]
MIRYTTLRRLSLAERETLGEYGYASLERYRISREEEADAIVFRLQRERLETPYRKVYEYDEETDWRIALGYSIGAFEEDRLLGFLIAEPQMWNRTLHLMDLHVALPHRQRGIGRGLLEEMGVLARGRGFRALAAETQNTNGPAMAFYRACGFALDGLDLTLYDGLDETALFMKKHL